MSSPLIPGSVLGDAADAHDHVADRGEQCFTGRSPRSHSRAHPPVEFGRSARWDCEVIPPLTHEMLADQRDLAGVPGVVSELPRNRQCNRMWLVSNSDDASQIGICQWLQCVEHALPAIFPLHHQFSPWKLKVEELGFTIAAGLLAIGGEEIGPTRNHVAGYVLHDGGDTILQRIDPAMQASRIDLRMAASQ